MLSELSYRHQPHHFAQDSYSKRLKIPTTAHSIPHTQSLTDPLVPNVKHLTENQQSRPRRKSITYQDQQHPERLLHYGVPSCSLSSPSNQTLYFGSCPREADGSEYMLRRKTPNGTVAAGYDGNVADKIKRPPSMKHLPPPAGRSSRVKSTPSSSNLIPLNEDASLQLGQSFSARMGMLQGYDMEFRDAPDTRSFSDEKRAVLGHSQNTLILGGVDSVLDHHVLPPLESTASQSIPTVLQPMWPPSSGPTSIQAPSPFGPYWLDGAFQTFRPASLCENRYHDRSWGQSTPGDGGSYMAGAPNTWFGSSEASIPHHARDCAISSCKRPSSNDRYFGPAEGSLQVNLPHDFHSKLALDQDGNVSAEKLVSHAPAHNEYDYFARQVGSQSILEPPHEHPHFKEKILQWAYRIYCNLLNSFEQSRRGQPFNGGQVLPSANHLQLPRRPYPSWSGKPRLCTSDVQLPDHPNAQASVASGSLIAENPPLPAVGRAPIYHGSDITSVCASKRPHEGFAAVQQSVQPQLQRLRTYQPTTYPSYIPQSFAQTSGSDSPAVAATKALEILTRLCQESQWQWLDGMLLNGCLAYGLGDYSKATKWYLKVLHHDCNNIEAISNLAATCLSLGRRQEAEGYWMRAVKLRPNYFEAVEHLVGLLHEEHRSKEAVSIIAFVEDALGGQQYLRSAHRYPNLIHQISGSSGYSIPSRDNGRLLALIHGKGNVLYQSSDNDGAARAFEEAILIGAGQHEGGINGLIKRILRVFREQRRSVTFLPGSEDTRSNDEPILLPPETALETSNLVFPPNGMLPGLQDVPHGMSQKAAISVVSNSLLSLAKIYQDSMSSSGASATAPRATSGVQEILALYYLSLSLQPSPSTANNVGILLAGVQQSARVSHHIASIRSPFTGFTGVTPGSGVALALAYYDYGLKLDARHAHLYTNLGSLFKDIGQLPAAIKMYEKAVECDGKFDIALANLANAVKDKGLIKDAIEYYRRAVAANPDFAEAVCGLANALNSVCDWTGRGGISNALGSRDRWHVDSHGMPYDPRIFAAPSSGWIERVVSIVDKQLLDGQNWGKGVIRSIGADDILRHVGYSAIDGDTKNVLRQALASWNEKLWEGAKIVRLIERATKRLGWLIYQERYVQRSRPTTNRIRPQLPAALAVPSAPTVLPFHTFTCPLSAQQIRRISQRNGLRVSCSTLRAPWLPTQIYEPPCPPKPHLNVGYVSSDFNNHPLAHLMQSVFGFHDRSRFKAICYATTASDGSVHRQQIERESPVFHDASSWSLESLVNQIVSDGIHILVNLNGYTRGAKNEIFAARPAPIQMSFMGFAGTLGAEWCDYLLADKIAIPPSTLRPFRVNVSLENQTRDGNYENVADDWVYGENIIFTRDTFFCCDHRQSAPDAQDEQLSWVDEQRRRWRMRKELFPKLADDAIILGNFNQLYKIEPTTFRTWLRILSRVPKAVLWLLRFPEVGEENLIQTAMKWGGKEVASRIIFTEVAPKHQHITRARVCDLFVDTPECNAHTTAADVLWSGTPLLTLPRYEYKMCSRMAASILRGALPKTAEGDCAAEDLIAANDEVYEEQGVELASDLVYPLNEGERGFGRGRLMEVRRLLYESRWTSALFDTRRWVHDLETAYEEVWRRWVAGEGGDIWL